MKPSPPQILLLLSGGLDSTACLCYYSALRARIHPLFVDFGQAAAKRELLSAQKVAKHYGVKLDRATVSVGREFGKGEIAGRNALLLFLAIMRYAPKSGIVAMGIHKGSRYYDTSPAFIHDVQALFEGYFSGSVRFEAPFADWTKRMIFDYCLKNKVPVADTYSCEVSGVPCGKCLSCRDKEALLAR